MREQPSGDVAAGRTCVVYGRIACATLRATRMTLSLSDGSLAAVRALTKMFRALSLRASSIRASPPVKKKLAALSALGQDQKALDDPRHRMVLPSKRRANRGTGINRRAGGRSGELMLAPSR